MFLVLCNYLQCKYKTFFNIQQKKQQNFLKKKTFLENQFTDKEIANNSFENLKEMNTIASLKPKWPVVKLDNLSAKHFYDKVKDIKEPFVWTIDPDVRENLKLLNDGYMPEITNVDKIHSWQKQNSLISFTLS